MTKRKRMVRPTEQEVAIRMADRGLKPDLAVSEAVKFMGYWESKGWCRGTEPMRSWEGSVAQWVANADPSKLTGKEIMNRAAKADFLRKALANE